MGPRRILRLSSQSYFRSATESEPSASAEFARALQGKSVYEQNHDASALRAEQQLKSWLRDVTSLSEVNWDPSKHPRRGTAPNAGWFASVSGALSKIVRPSERSDQFVDRPSSLSRGLHIDGTPARIQVLPNITSDDRPDSSKLAFMAQPRQPKSKAATRKTDLIADPLDPSHWFLPSDDKGTWAGAKGNSTLRLKEPAFVNGRLVKEIDFSSNLPILDTHVLPGKTPTIVITGDRATDARSAAEAWKQLNKGKKLPVDGIFHHDLRNVTVQTVPHNGKKVKVLVGKMQLVPKQINAIVFHEGSASAAIKLYRGLGTNLDSVKQIAKTELSRLGKTGSLLDRSASKIVAGKTPKVLRRFIGRNIVRVIPIVGTTGLAIVDFAENAEAHGVEGAVARAIPLLGDLISAYDLGSDLAKEITDEAAAMEKAAYDDANGAVREAAQLANQQAAEAFEELAKQIQVTNEIGTYGRVNAQKVANALSIYRAQMHGANLARAANAPGLNYEKTAQRAKRALRNRLIRACQPVTRPQPIPTL